VSTTDTGALYLKTAESSEVKKKLKINPELQTTYNSWDDS
jgi:hypothetical protein